MLQESVKGISRKFEECFKGVLSEFHVGFKRVSRVFKEVQRLF